MVVLEILGTKIEDSGTYTCRATNKWGQAEISVTLECIDISKGQKPTFTTHIKVFNNFNYNNNIHVFVNSYICFEYMCLFQMVVIMFHN